MDIQTEINENNYDNKSTIRLIKEKTKEKALKEVEYQLDLNGAEMSYKDLLEHLSLMFTGGKDESTLMADFYSHTQKAKELEESFADELQVLAQKVISKRPNFQQGLDSELKNQYVNQLYDCHSVAIVKSLLFQLPPQTVSLNLSTIMNPWDTEQERACKGYSCSNISSGAGGN